MKRKIVAGMLCLSMVLQAGAVTGRAEVLVQPEANGVQLEAGITQQEEPQYVVIGETIGQIEEILGTGTVRSISEEEEPQPGEETMEEAGILVTELEPQDVEDLKAAGITVEEDIEFTASSVVVVAETPDPEVATESEMKESVEQETEQTLPIENPEQNSAQAVAEWNIAAVHGEEYVSEAVVEPVKVAVLDSGINYRPDLPVAGHISMLTDRDGGNPMFEDGTGHGTAVASLISSTPGDESIQGMNQGAQVYCVQVLGSQNTGKLSSIVKGIYWSIENDMDIINMSLGTPTDSTALKKAVMDADAAGIMMVAAAGNSSTEAVQYPAAYEEVLSVGSSNMQGEIAENSAKGAKVDIYAPGEEVLVSTPLFGTSTESGTSMAAAEVTAAASILLGRDKAKGSRFISELLKQTANCRMDDGNGNGLLDVEEAYERYGEFSGHDGQEAAREMEEANEKALEVFEEEEVKALWHDKEHQETVPSDANGYQLMVAVSTFPDIPGHFVFHGNNGSTVPNPLYVNRRFHGSKNYKQTLKFLVDLAHAYYTKNDIAVQNLYNNPGGGLNTVEHKENGESFQFSTVEAIQKFLNSYFFVSGLDETTRHNKAYKIMGVAAHMIGDTYAHRTILTQKGADDIYNLNGGKDQFNFVNWKNFYSEACGGKVECRKIKNYLRDKNKDNYEDNTAVQNARYKYAKTAVEELLRNGTGYDFRTHAYNESVFNHIQTLTKE